MSKDKYLSIFSPQMEAIVSVYYPSIFFAAHEVLKIGELRDVFRPIAREQKDLMDYKCW